ncbi:1,2-phenylacetyl-CoA epoxidase subunit PaaC [Aureitalea marina]|uniref:Phenylacetate-CoA oxygenase subunit PaaI n=1 Tax=Aureitalea marina TaxID=930804 RepID=A0A2S7KQY5_9FLAO|nr:1,2-phenylacetyl-CoA epoxidase subunit PaaC [Aureitalea marina]PQB05035.1 phenylacetate-CoA oxygenase subunit PaaI [Aureitalea marina]
MEFTDKDRYTYVIGIADNMLILGQRLGELCGHGPNLETDIALTNIALDLFGQVRSYYQYAAQLVGENKSEDDVAFLRREREYLNALLVEQPNTHFGYVIGRQFLFDVFHLLMLKELVKSNDETLRAIAAKGIKEVSYHQRFSGDWLKRLGDGTEESQHKMQEAMNDLLPYTRELFEMTEADTKAFEAGVGVNLGSLYEQYQEIVQEHLEEATLDMPEELYFKSGGKQGIHSEHMGYILTDMQYMQRTYPQMNW